jgi:hypothetical protein
MTIFRIYVENGDRADFWVQHRSWRNTCARVLTVGGLQLGRLSGSPPNYGLPDVRVRWHDIRSGRPVPPPEPVDETNVHPEVETEIDFDAAPTPPPVAARPPAVAHPDGDEHLPDPADIHYARIAEPAWSRGFRERHPASQPRTLLQRQRAAAKLELR